MYQKLKDNIINPKGLIRRMKDKPLPTLGFFILFSSILALPGIVRVLALMNSLQTLRHRFAKNLLVILISLVRLMKPLLVKQMRFIPLLKIHSLLLLIHLVNIPLQTMELSLSLQKIQ